MSKTDNQHLFFFLLKLFDIKKGLLSYCKAFNTESMVLTKIGCGY